MSVNLDLFGNPIQTDELLRDKFIEPPFSILDSRGTHWQKRKKLWKGRGIKSEIGREENKLKYSPTIVATRPAYNGTSIFDPVICELMYHWFCPDGGKILDPFAGGSVRGIVANYLGYKYTGIDIREEQIASNLEQAAQILPPNNCPEWLLGDSNDVLNKEWEEGFDLVFSCPPYFDLEVYSDDPKDLSTMNDEDFLVVYESIIKKSCDKLKKDGFAIFVVGDVRDKKTGFYKDFITATKMAFYKAGMKLYNEAIYLENGLNTAAMKANNLMKRLKLVKVHQNILVFKKIN